MEVIEDGHYSSHPLFLQKKVGPGYESYLMSFQALSALDVFQTKFTDVNDGFFGQLLRIWGKVPWLHPITSQLYHIDVLHPCDNII